jgi:hypothetical protein
VQRQAAEAIAAPGRPQYAVLWLEALGFTHLASRDRAKFGSLLDTEFEDASGWRVYHAPARSAAPAVLVSRYAWKNLPPFHSLYDRRALEAYDTWADRPEPAGFRWIAAEAAEVRADVGPDDMILVRHSVPPGCRASIDGRPIECLRDPIGFLVLDPARSGFVTIRLTLPAGVADVAPLSTETFPVINEGGVVHATSGQQPPFRPGALIAIFGSGLAGSGKTRVLVAGRDAEVLYAAESQVNARLPADLPPGRVALVVEVGSARSEPVEIEVGGGP